ncbi:hypothetical protein [Halomarina oriensis]|uniref:Uncharacterized protein n=1 Tax=Halomarina oriensis TaxID=671145 RepID=A0A6B0GNC5_9EURY|nr:hypothetical protein [Halomarina oriensis]MWG36180.1 hypothetical protein [Halomarina oriensis]
MVLSRLLGGLAVLSVAGLTLGTLWTLLGLLTGEYVVASALALALVLVVAGGGVLAGRRSGRWTANPYW